MPDITMCTSSTCQNREQCYRAMAKPDKYQSYADFTKLCAEKDFRCQWVVTDREVLADDINCLLVRC
jgi:hypothetical protein